MLKAYSADFFHDGMAEFVAETHFNQTPGGAYMTNDFGNAYGPMGVGFYECERLNEKRVVDTQIVRGSPRNHGGWAIGNDMGLFPLLPAHHRVEMGRGTIAGHFGIRPGDVVVGDIDGVLVVPRDIAYDVLIRAEEIKANEKMRLLQNPPDAAPDGLRRGAFCKLKSSAAHSGHA